MGKVDVIKIKKSEIIEGELAIDHERGVVYFHTTDPEVINRYHAVTILRVSQIETPIPDNTTLDITARHLDD